MFGVIAALAALVAVALIVSVTFWGGEATVAFPQVRQPNSEVSSQTIAVPLEAKRPVQSLKVVIGKIKAVDGAHLVIEVSRTTPAQLTFALVGTLIKVRDKEGTSSDLKPGDLVEVTYRQSGEKRIAKTVTDRPTRVRGE